MSTRHHLSDRGSGMTNNLPARRSPGLWLFIHHLCRLLRRDAADRSSDLTPGEINERYKLLLECGF
jgi:hypothetical protein